jgi:hypothetical protein
MRKRAPLHYDKTTGAWTVDLPTFAMIPGTFLPIIKDKIDANGILLAFTEEDQARYHPTVEVEIPDHWPKNDTGELDHKKLRAMYTEHPRFGSKGWTPPKLH